MLTFAATSSTERREKATRVVRSILIDLFDTNHCKEVSSSTAQN
jgi:hypothetical protein